MLILNIPRELLSKNSNIHLIALTNAADVKSAGHNKILNFILRDIRVLKEMGVHVGHGYNLHLKGTIVNVAADNLGANACSGFVTCFNAKYFCRICECAKTECEVLVDEDPSKLRTKDSHDAILKSLEESTVNNMVLSTDHSC